MEQYYLQKKSCHVWYMYIGMLSGINVCRCFWCICEASGLLPSQRVTCLGFGSRGLQRRPKPAGGILSKSTKTGRPSCQQRGGLVKPTTRWTQIVTTQSPSNLGPRRSMSPSPSPTTDGQPGHPKLELPWEEEGLRHQIKPAQESTRETCHIHRLTRCGRFGSAYEDNKWKSPKNHAWKCDGSLGVHKNFVPQTNGRREVC